MCGGGGRGSLCVCGGWGVGVTLCVWGGGWRGGHSVCVWGGGGELPNCTAVLQQEAMRLLVAGVMAASRYVVVPGFEEKG